MDYLFACDQSTRVIIDHQNLLFDFSPVAMEPSLGSHKVLNVVRWALYLSAFTYRIEHVLGDMNKWRDKMTRWMRSYRRAPAIKLIAPSHLFSEVTRSPDSPVFNCPSRVEILEAQKRYKNLASSDATADDSELLPIKGTI